MDQKTNDQKFTKDRGGKGIEKRTQEFIIKDYDKINFISGTMDRSTYKGCFLEIKGHFSSKTGNHDLMMRKVLNQIRYGIERNMDKEFFMDNFLSINEVSNSFTQTGSSFTKLEFTLFPKKKTDKNELTNKLNEICEKIYDEIIINNDYMEFHKSIQRSTHAKK
jgi:transcriptional/translational regulatory protein YebC/TACO1